MPIEQLLAMYGRYPTEESDSNMEANGENEGIEGDNEVVPSETAENEVEEIDDADAVTSNSSTSDENVNGNDKQSIIEIKTESGKPERKKKQSELVQLYPELDTNGDAAGAASSRSLRCKIFV